MTGKSESAVPEGAAGEIPAGAAPGGPPRAEFRGVAKRFGDRLVFSGLDFKIPSGGRYALLGPNGAGKSTLSRLLAGVLAPDEGTVLVGGLKPHRRPAEVRRRLGLLPEGAPLAGELTVDEHLTLAARLRGLSAAARRSERDRLAEALGLGRFLRRPAGLLSQGQRRRTALASALLGGPDLLILDEPASGLDPEESARLTNLLTGLPPETTLLISSHILGEVRQMTDQVLVLGRGRLLAHGPWDRALPGEPRAAYLALAGAGEDS